ncbi:MAG: adenylosuccinate synthetase [Streptosporangiaceae bacterium]
MNHVIVVDLGYGDAGKGTVVDWLCSPLAGGSGGSGGSGRSGGSGGSGGSGRSGRSGGLGGGPVHTVVRFNGGAQAGHNVVTADGRHHTFAQFGSGTFWPGVRTYLSRFMLVDPLALAAEAAHLAAVGVPDAIGRLAVDADALLTTPYHRAANRARELARGRDRHGSCGMGIGETASYALPASRDAPRVGDCAAPRVLAGKLGRLRDRLSDELGPLDAPPVPDLCEAYRAFAAAVEVVGSGYLPRVLRRGRVVFEGAQGVLLDEWRGFHPYTTWSTTTFANAETLLAEAGATGLRLGVVRSYLTRHGPGPFVTEDPALELPEPHNRSGHWQGAFRLGHFDAVALRYAVSAAGGVDALAVTHLDTVERLGTGMRVCDGYLVDGRPVARIVPGPGRDLGYQERLTGMLLRARPSYADAEGDWPGVIEAALGAPVAVLSRGPAAADKRTARLSCRAA